MTSFTSHDEVQTGIYTALVPGGVLDSTLAGLGCNAVYDIRAVPQNAPFDYIVIGQGYELNNDTFGTTNANGFVYMAQIDIWSRQAATKPASLMLNRCNQLLHRQPLTLPTLNHVGTIYQRANWLADPDGYTLHAVIYYKVYTQQ